MGGNYYLLNGKNGEGNTLDLYVDGYLKRDFIDIAALDLETMKIDRNNASLILSQYNPDLDLSGRFYDALYPYKKSETKTFVPIFNFEGKEYKYFMDNLHYFAEQRKYNKEHHNSVQLEDNSFLDNYISNIVYRILKEKRIEMLQYERTIGYKLQKLLKEGFESNKSPVDFTKSNLYMLKRYLDHYTQLRDFTLEYMLSLSGERYPLRSDLNRSARFENYGMEPREQAFIRKEKVSDKQVKYYQMSLADFDHLMKKSFK